MEVVPLAGRGVEFPVYLVVDFGPGEADRCPFAFRAGATVRPTQPNRPFT